MVGSRWDNLMTKKKIFHIDELRAVVDAGYHSKKNNDHDWVKYVLQTEDGRSAYDKYFEYLTDRGQDYFEECMDVAIGDCDDYYRMLKNEVLTEEKKKRLNAEMNGWIEAAFDEFLED